MLLCDIGNTNIHFYKNGVIWKKRANAKNINLIDEKFYYINVNEKLKNILKLNKLAINIETYFHLDTAYKGMGIDRIASCCAIDNGIIIDAGSAVTVDIMSGGIHLGGYIMPGLLSLQNAFENISPKLKMNINPNISLCSLPQNSLEAISYGAIKPFILMFNETKKNKKIYFTGGDGKFFTKFFNDSVYDDSLIFKGMLKVIKDINA